MENKTAEFGQTSWTFADFLSTYRFWALFFSSLFIAVAGVGLNTTMPAVMYQTGNSAEVIGVFYGSISVGWIAGAVLAFALASRNGRAALIWPSAVCVAITLVLLPMLTNWMSPTLLIPLGLSWGAAHAVFPLAVAIFLVGGRANRTDFGCAFVLLSTTLFIANFTPIATVPLLGLDEAVLPMLIAFLTCLLLAIAFVAPARGLGFDDAPRVRHRPLQPTARSPVLVAAILFAPAVLFILLGLVIAIAQPEEFRTGELTTATALMIFVVFCVGVAALAYLGYWVYRIHGELAGAAPSQRLLTPLAAVLVALLVPLGLPILLVTLGDLLNQRARDDGKDRAISIGWMALWTLLLPPVAIAMVQNAANKSYREPAQKGIGA